MILLTNPTIIIWQNHQRYQLGSLTHNIHIWYIYLHLVDFYGINVGNYTIHGCVMGDFANELGFVSWVICLKYFQGQLFPVEKNNNDFFGGI